MPRVNGRYTGRRNAFTCFIALCTTVAMAVAWSKLPDLFTATSQLSMTQSSRPLAGSTHFYVTQSAETLRRTQIALQPTDTDTDTDTFNSTTTLENKASLLNRVEASHEQTAFIEASTQELMQLKACPNCQKGYEARLSDPEFRDKVAALEHGRLRCLREIRQHVMTIFEPLFPGVKRVVLMDVALHTNLGDSVLVRAAVHTVALFGHSVNHVCFASQGAEKLYDTITQFQYCDLNHIMELVKDDGLILYSGGGNWGNLYRFVQSYRMKAFQLFAYGSLKPGYNFSIVQLPQTIHYTDTDDISKDVDETLLNGLPEGFLTLLLRQEESLAIAEKTIGANVHKQLCPDLAFALGNLLPIGEPEVDVLVLAREDDEQQEVDREESVQIQTILTAANLTFVIRDWQYEPENLEFSKSNPTVMSEVRLNEAVKVVSMGRMVITNRLHGSVLATMIGRTLLWVDTPQKKVAGVRKTAFDVSSSCTDQNLRSFEFPSMVSATKAAVRYLRDGPDIETLIADAALSET